MKNLKTLVVTNKGRIGKTGLVLGLLGLGAFAVTHFLKKAEDEKVYAEYPEEDDDDMDFEDDFEETEPEEV